MLSLRGRGVFSELWWTYYHLNQHLCIMAGFHVLKMPFKCHLSVTWNGFEWYHYFIHGAFKHLVWLESLALAHWLTLSLAANLTFQTIPFTLVCDLDPFRMHTMMKIFFHPCFFFCSLASITTFCAGVMIQLFVPEVDKVINVKEENSPVKFPMYCTQLSPFFIYSWGYANDFLLFLWLCSHYLQDDYYLKMYFIYGDFGGFSMHLILQILVNDHNRAIFN